MNAEIEKRNGTDFTIAGKYKVLEIIGNGSYGLVLRALDLDENKQVAVKLAMNKGGTYKKNIVEAQILEKINKVDSRLSRYVIKLKIWFTVKDCVIIVMELKSGSLRQRISKNMIRQYSKLSKYALNMVEFLYFMSQLDIIHGDLKPENILLDEADDELVFADFGLSYAPFVKNKPRLIQTLYYRAPEVFLGYDYTSSADTWSIGCILLECLTGNCPFYGENADDVMEAILAKVGSPRQEYIERAPNRSSYFTRIDGLWVLKGYREPIKPIGFRLVNRICNEKYDQFIDLVQKMLCFEPELRISPEEALDHPFLKSKK